MANMVDLFNLERRLLYIYDDPLHEGERKFGKEVKKAPININADYISCVGDTRHKRQLIEELYDACFTNLIHPWTIKCKSAKLGTGILIQPNAMIYANAVIGDHVTLCGACNVGHDSVVGDYSTLGHHVFLGGRVTISDGVFMGSESMVKPGVTIGEGAIIGMGAKIVKDVPPNTVIYEKTEWKTRTLDPW